MLEKKKKILFIDDEPDQIMMISLRLKKNGYAVISAMDGEQGLKKASEEKPDLILLDVLMPGIDGLEVCRRLRKDPATKHIPIVATTAAGADDIELQCRAAGADDCVRKPYDSPDLLTKIRQLLEK
ncbi:MAG: response regulator [Candidatus Omnitrophica bacterium]|nr:response regulator [Candidatus Omnitrophota bacterium]